MAALGHVSAATSQQAETRSLRDRGRPGRAAELGTDVRDVPVHGVRAQHELLGDFTVTESAGNAGEDFALPI
jgi:hypothetical protein